MKLNKNMLIAAAIAGALSAYSTIARAETSLLATGPNAEKQGCQGKDKAGMDKDKASCQGKAGMDKNAKKDKDKASCSGKDGCGGKDKKK